MIILDVHKCESICRRKEPPQVSQGNTLKIWNTIQPVCIKFITCNPYDQEHKQPDTFTRRVNKVAPQPFHYCISLKLPTWWNTMNQNKLRNHCKSHKLNNESQVKNCIAKERIVQHKNRNTEKIKWTQIYIWQLQSFWKRHWKMQQLHTQCPTAKCLAV